jgi:hypothetical protein
MVEPSARLVQFGCDERIVVGAGQQMVLAQLARRPHGMGAQHRVIVGKVAHQGVLHPGIGTAL